MLSIRSLQLVIALNRFRNFSRAAASLGVSQPSLTRSLKGLEDSLGVQLFDRHHVAPTVFGQTLIDRGQAVITSFDDLAREIARLKGLETGQLKVVMGPYPADISGNRAVALLSARYPHLTVEVTVRDWTRATAEVISGVADLGFADITEASRNSNLITEPVHAAPLQGALQIPALRGQTCTPKHTSDQDLIALAPSLPAQPMIKAHPKTWTEEVNEPGIKRRIVREICCSIDRARYSSRGDVHGVAPADFGADVHPNWPLADIVCACCAGDFGFYEAAGSGGRSAVDHPRAEPGRNWRVFNADGAVSASATHLVILCAFSVFETWRAHNLNSYGRGAVCEKFSI